MRIFYDGQIFAWQPAGGIGRYFANLIRELPPSFEPTLTLYGGEQNVLVPAHANLAVVRRRAFRPQALARRVAARHFARALATSEPHVVHPTYYSMLSGQRLDRLDRPLVVTVHDMIHERFRAELDPAGHVVAAKRRAILAADAVICVSENTRQDLVDAYPVADDRIFVVPEASELERPSTPAPTPSKPYFLYVGSRSHSYKNFDRVLHALAAVRAQGAECELRLAGPPLERAEIGRLRASGLTDAVHAAPWVDDAQLAHLYAGSVALIYPSLYEGFGIPPLEAMRCGTAVIAGNVASVPEVVGDAALLIDPTSVEALAHAMLELSERPDRRAALVAAGAARVRLFSWAETARRTVAVYESLSA